MQFEPRSVATAAAHLWTLPAPEAYLKKLESRFQEASPKDMIPLDFGVELIPARKKVPRV